MESIVRKSRSCFFCGREGNLHRHHCFFGAKRKLAEQDGLWVWICPECHQGTDGVHGKHGHGKDLTLKQAAQVAYMCTYDKTEDDFRHRYGKSYIGL